jgi:hypothetical protein
MKRLASLVLLTVAFGLSAAEGLSAADKKSIVDDIGETLNERAYVPSVAFDTWKDYVRAEQEAIDRASDESSFARAANRALGRFNISHVELFTPAQAVRYGITRSGIGARLLQSEAGAMTLTWPEEKIALLRITTFDEGYDRNKLATLMTEAKKADALILDLRGNGGGASANIGNLLSYLLPDRTAYGVFVSRRLVEGYKQANPGQPVDVFRVAAWAPNKSMTRARNVEPYKGRIVVMINGGSASAAEITAAALQEHGAKLVGTPSAGAVLASTYFRLTGGFYLQAPVSDYVTIKGVRLEHQPLKPDVYVERRTQVLPAALETAKRG